MKLGNLQIRPEVDAPIYWAHLILISILILGMLYLAKSAIQFNFTNTLILSGLLAVGDILSHTLLKLN